MNVSKTVSRSGTITSRTRIYPDWLLGLKHHATSVHEPCSESSHPVSQIIAEASHLPVARERGDVHTMSSTPSRTSTSIPPTPITTHVDESDIVDRRFAQVPIETLDIRHPKVAHLLGQAP